MLQVLQQPDVAADIWALKYRYDGETGVAESFVRVAKAVAAGVESFVPKPYTAEALLKVLAALFKKEP